MLRFFLEMLKRKFKDRKFKEFKITSAFFKKDLRSLLFFNPRKITSLNMGHKTGKHTERQICRIYSKLCLHIQNINRNEQIKLFIKLKHKGIANSRKKTF